MEEPTSPREPERSLATCADPRSGRRYAEANRKGRGKRAMSSTEIAAIAHRLLPLCRAHRVSAVVLERLVSADVPADVPVKGSTPSVGVQRFLHAVLSDELRLEESGRVGPRG